jgi:broad specificity phosphatase PhoE
MTTPAEKPGAITLVRHGEPDISRKIKFNAKAYAAWWLVYETKGLRPGQTPPPALVALGRRAGAVITSTRKRAIETSQAVVGDRAIAIDPLFIESPLPAPPFPGWVKFSPKIWGFMSRFCWWFFNNHEAGQECRKEAEARADHAADLLEGLAADGQEVLVMAHGFFNTLVARALRQRGWKLTEDQGYKYWTMKRLERVA